MSVFKKLTMSVLALVMMPLTAMADHEFSPITDWEVLYERRNWRLDLNAHVDGGFSCESRTVNGRGYSMSIFTWEDGMVSVRFQSSGWDFGNVISPVDFVVKIDGRPQWDINGSQFDDYVQLTMSTPNTDLTRFLREVRAGNTLYLGDSRGREITRFSLAGTTATLNAHGTCETRVMGGSYNPSNPF